LENLPRIVAVVEDDQSMLTSIERLLNAHGLETQGYGSASAFLESNMLGMLSCVILDIHLGSDSGIELRRQIRAAGRSLPVIFITASDDEALEAAAREAGCIAFLHKPFAGELLLAAISKAVR
jgi:FixJ family two-component response regulator